ncbi:MAG TPA: adenosylcobinamide-phosphate synthase CbiB [Kiloniellales bacterium]|nr:adenosylcobinamide-phosphate synthase CbiB [Kiloniellales bacterium]
MSFDANLALLAAALLLEALIGYPQALFRRFRHPVVWLGALVAGCDRRLNRESLSDSTRRRNGTMTLVLLLVVTALPTVALQILLLRWLDWWAAALVLAVPASMLLAQRSLHEHVAAVARSLETEGLAGGRRAVSQIVGRDPEALDEAGISRAAIESLAENFSDGVVAPAFWCAIGGLPGIALYKAINTADSMIGHKTPRHLAFGWAAARFDDLVNLPASRLAALWLLLAAAVSGKSVGGAWRALWRDAGHHKSPNAGWPEAAMAGALGIRLAGPRRYHGVLVDDGWMGDGRAELTAADIRRALALYRLAATIQFVVVAALVVVIARF